MRNQKTCQNLSSKYHKKLNIVIPQTKLNQQRKPKHRRINSELNKNNQKDFICEDHHLNFEKYCINCKEDICNKCYKENHLIHDTIKYDELSLNEKQIEIFRKKYDEYITKYHELMKKIKEWQTTFNNNIKYFEDFMQNKIINVINKMINEYKEENLNYNTIIEYRIAYSLLIENNEDKLNNQKIIKLMKTYRSLKNYKDYKYINENENLSTISLDNILNFNDIINKGNFEKKGNNIIKFLFSNYSLYQNKNEDDNIIKKLMDIKQRKNNNILNKVKKTNKSSTNIFQNSSNTFKKILLNKEDNIYEKKKPLNAKRTIENEFEKGDIPILNKNKLIENEFDDDIKDNININSIINEKNNIRKKEKKKAFNNIFKNTNFFNKEEFEDDFNDFDELDLETDFNYNTENSKRNRGPIIFNNNINNFNSINNINNKNNYISNYNIEQLYSDRSHKSRVFTHKKYNSTLTEFRSQKNINILNQSQSDNGNDKNKENEYNTIDFNTYNFETYSNVIANNYYSNNTLSNRIFPENINMKITKEIEIDPDKDLNIGFELGNSICRLGIINKSLNNIELWQPYDMNEINIPTIINFKDRNDNLLIGKEAEKEKINNPNYTIFNFVKLFDKNWDEMEGNKELWGFKLYNNAKTGKPYIKGNHKSFRNKIYNIEDILTLFLKNLFDIFFSKIKIKKSKCKLLKINFVVTVPDYFNYLQRKVLEKIFLTQLFDTNSKIKNKEYIYYLGKNNIENVQIKNIKIENSSNLGFLFPFQNNENIKNNKNSNVILIYVEGSSVNISLISTLYGGNALISPTKKIKNDENMNKYEIKGIKWLSFGEEDFTDNFENLYLSEKIKEECYNNSSSLAKLRSSFENAKNDFYEKSKNEIIIKNLYNNNDFRIILDKSDYEKSCENHFNKIIDLIKELLKETSISEDLINDIIFIGNTTNVNIIKQKIESIFNSKNKSLCKKLFENPENKSKEINPYLTVLGAVIQSYNLFSKEKILYKYKEITPISFGIEGFNKKMILMIKKGSQIPIKVNKKVKFLKIKEESVNININIYEGEDEFVNKNRLISKAVVDTNNLKNEIEDEDCIEIMVQFIINQNFDLRAFILDSKTLKRKLECVINIDIVHE